MKFNCPIHFSLNRQITHVCLQYQCKERLLCELCFSEHNNHMIIPIQDCQESFTRANHKWGGAMINEVLIFLHQNKNENENKDLLIHEKEIEHQVEFIFEQFLCEIAVKLREVKRYITQELQRMVRVAEENLQYLKERVDQLYPLKEIGVALEKLENGTYNPTVMNEILRNFAEQIHGNTEVQNIYKHLSQDGVNHNYLDIVQINLQGFHTFKSKILSNFGKMSDFDQYLPQNYGRLPTKTHATFSWNLVNQFKEVKELSKLSCFTQINRLVVLSNNLVKCVLDDKCIKQYCINGKFLRTLHKCQAQDFYLSTYFHGDHLIILALWSNALDLELWQNNKKICIVRNAAANPIKKIVLLGKYHLYREGNEKCIVTLDSQGCVKVNELQSHYVYDVSFGQGIQDICILPDTKYTLKQAISIDQEVIFDFVVCSYLMKKLKLRVRSIFQGIAISKIEEEETLESKFGLTEHCQVDFVVCKLSEYEKSYLKKQMHIEGIDYCIVSLLNTLVTLWNWRTGKSIRVIDCQESYGLRILPTIQNGLIHQIILIGVEGKIHLINWILNKISSHKLKIGQNLQIHQMSEYYYTDNRNTNFLLALRQQGYQYMIISQLNYY